MGSKGPEEAGSPAQAVIAYVALGSNLGDRLGHLCLARTRLSRHPAITLRAASRIYETAPVGPPPQGPYLNAVLELATTLDARALLEVLLDIETAAGRRRDPAAARWGARTLDVDLLLFGRARIDEPDLAVPHPRLHERAFVLEPLCDVAPDVEHPTLGGALRLHAERCRDGDAVWLLAGDGRWPPEVVGGAAGAAGPERAKGG